MKLLKVMLSALCIVALCAGCPKKTEENGDGGTDTPKEEPTDKDGDDATTE